MSPTNVKEYKKIIALHFSPEISRQPHMYNLAKDHNLTFNILRARISPRQEGHMIVELSGREEDYKKGIEYLQERGVKITSVEQNISRDEDSCIHCGVCTAMCPTGALHLDRESRRIEFDRSVCTACGLCTNVCTVHAMNIMINDQDW